MYALGKHHEGHIGRECRDDWSVYQWIGHVQLGILVERMVRPQKIDAQYYRYLLHAIDAADKVALQAQMRPTMIGSVDESLGCERSSKGCTQALEGGSLS